MRIVIGSGNNQRTFQEGTDAYSNLFQGMKDTAKTIQSYRKNYYKPNSTATRRQTESLVNAIVDRAKSSVMVEMQRRANKWARETVAEFKNYVPVDTGNLRNSIGILKFDVGDNYINVSVGVNESKIVPPPKYMRRANGKIRTMPDYDYSPYVLGSGGSGEGINYGVAEMVGRGRASSRGNLISTRFSQIARQNAKKIIEKK